MKILFIICVLLLICCTKSESSDFSSSKTKKEQGAPIQDIYKNEPIYMDFNIYFTNFYDAVERRDEKRLITMLADTVSDTVVFNDRVSRLEIAKNIDLYMLKRLVAKGYSIGTTIDSVQAAYCPPFTSLETEKYGLRFLRIDTLEKQQSWNLPNGWRLTDIIRSP